MKCSNRRHRCESPGAGAELQTRSLSNDAAKGGLMRRRLNTSDIILLTILAGCVLIVGSQILVALR